MAINISAGAGTRASTTNSLCSLIPRLSGELRSKHHIGPVIGGVEGVGREESGGVGSPIGIDAVAAGRGGGRRGQCSARERGGKEVVGRHIGASCVVRRDIGGVGTDR